MSRVDDLKARLSDAEPSFAIKGNEGRRHLMGFTGPQRRTDNCKHCAFVGHELLGTGGLFEREELHCQVGGFKVAGGGICEHWGKKP